MELAGANCFAEVAKLKPSAVASRLRWAAGASDAANDGISPQCV